MSGNIWEWCLSHWTQLVGAIDLMNTDSRVLCGGSWYGFRSSARAAYRDIAYDPYARDGHLGFWVCGVCPLG
jgi:formylglycine-generating enzyme required for sulfatase activity